MYALSKAWSKVNRADLMAAQGTLGTGLYSVQNIMATIILVDLS